MNNSLKLKSHPEAIAEGSYEILHSVQNDESGRTLVETLATLSIVGLLAWGTIRVYNGIVTRVKVQNTAKMIQTLAFERQNSAISAKTGSAMNVKGPHSALRVQNGTRGNHEPYFWVETTIKDESFCKGLKESDLIQAEFVEVDGVQDGPCTDNSKIAFYFKKDKGGNAYCPSNATNCNQYGDATGCEDGYYLDNGVCSACPEHMATCEDENTATSCAEGYELLWGACIEPKVCTTDLQCSICGECDVETGYCKEECAIPEPDANQDCGENECIVYDEDTQSCKNACTRVEYLESTGTQYIDTGIIGTNENIGIDVTWAFSNDDANMCIFSSRSAQTSNTFTLFWLKSASNRVRFDSVGQPYFTDGINTSVSDDIFNFNYKSADDAVATLTNKTTGQVQTKIIGKLATFSTNPLYLFFSVDTARVNSWIKMYNCQIYDGNALVRDFIPVTSPKGNCMFDKVSQKLFCNQGTGDDFKTNLDN